MAKGRVTENSLRVGQTVSTTYRYKYGDCKWRVTTAHISNNYELKNVKSGLSGGIIVEDFYFFYSKKKAKTKMKKLNKDLKNE